MLKKYIKSKQKYVLLFILYLGIFCLVAYLYGMPVDACVYALVLFSLHPYLCFTAICVTGSGWENSEISA